MTGFDALDLLAEIEDVGRDRRRGGYTRHVFDDAERELRDWFVERAQRLGLQVTADRNGNLWAWWGEPGPDAFVTGSHLDSVPGGGAHDGPLGVVSALAAVEQLKAAGFVPVAPARRRRLRRRGGVALRPGLPRFAAARRRRDSRPTRNS